MKPQSLLDVENAGQAVRNFNHQTIGRGDFTEPADAYDAVGSIVHLVQMLPQAMDQTVGWVLSAHRKGRVQHTEGLEGRELTQEMTRLLDKLSDASAAATLLLEALNEIHSATSYLYEEDTTPSATA